MFVTTDSLSRAEDMCAYLEEAAEYVVQALHVAPEEAVQDLTRLLERINRIMRDYDDKVVAATTATGFDD